MSSSEVRECTKWCPSVASRIAATTPRRVERNIRRATSPIMRIDRVPISATVKSHPKELVGPKIISPRAMHHLPRGGCTTKLPAVPKTSVVPLVNGTSWLVIEDLGVSSTPPLSRPTPSLT